MEMSNICIVPKETAFHDIDEGELGAEIHKRKHSGSYTKDIYRHEDFVEDEHRQEATSSSKPKQEEGQLPADPLGVPTQEGVAPYTQHSQGSVAEDVPQKVSHTANGARNTDREHKRPSYTAQVVVVLLMAWVIFSVANSRGFPGVVLLQFTDPNTDDLYLDPSNLALFVSIVNAGTMAGSLVAGQMLAPLGPRVVILIGLPLGVVSWIGLVFSNQLWVLMLCRTLMGCSFALVKPSTVMYTVEVAHESIRGRLVGILCIAREIGFSSSYLMGSLKLTWRQLCLVYGCLMIPPIVTLFFIPDSPRWLVNRGRVTEARKSLKFFRGRHHDVEVELLDIVSQACVTSKSKNSFWQQLKFLARPPTLQKFLLIGTLFVALSFQGTVTITPYLMIFLNIPGSPLDPALGGILCSCLKLSGAIVHLFLIDIIGRKPIMAVCLSYTSVCTTAYGFFYAQLENDSGASFSWLALTSIAVLQFISGVFGPVFDVLQGELLPTACRAVSLPLLMLSHSLAVFISLNTFPQLMEALGMQGVFGLFTLVSLAMAVLVVVALPETRGLSLETISAGSHSRAKQSTTDSVDFTNAHDQHKLCKFNTKQDDDSSLNKEHRDTHLV